MNRYDRMLYYSDNNWPCSIRVVARKVYGTTYPILYEILRDQGRFEYLGGRFIVTKEYQQFEHDMKDGRPGKTYDLKFFEGLIISPEIIETAKQQMRSDRRKKAEEEARWKEEARQRYEAEQNNVNSKQTGLFDMIIKLVESLFGPDAK